MDPTQPLLDWHDVARELIGFLASFLATGAVGFRFAVLRRLRTADGAESGAARSAERRAAAWGTLGAAIVLAQALLALPGAAAHGHTTVAAMLAHARPTQLQVGTMAMILAGLALALVRARAGWWLAALGVLGLALRSGISGRWSGVVNPVHEMAGGLWIGTLFMLLVAGLAGLGRSAVAPARRAALALEMVRAFSPLALASAALLATMGVITAWRHLERLSQLWTTPYGLTLCGKLLVVAGVLALGAYNWRRQTPRMGDEAGAAALARSARTEVMLALLVLVITAILVSLPSPRG